MNTETCVNPEGLSCLEMSVTARLSWAKRIFTIKWLILAMCTVLWGSTSAYAASATRTTANNVNVTHSASAQDVHLSATVAEVSSGNAVNEGSVTFVLKTILGSTTIGTPGGGVAVVNGSASVD